MNPKESNESTKLSVVVVNWNTRDLLRDCLASVYVTVGRSDFEVIVVENKSTDGSREMVKTEFPQVRLIENSENRGYAAANAQGMSAAKGEYLLCLNPDTVVFTGTIEKVLMFLEENPEYAAAGCRLKLPDGSYQTAVAKLFRPLHKFIIYGFLNQLYRAGLIGVHPHNGVTYSDDYLSSYGTVDYMIGAFMMIRRQLLETVGTVDPGFFFCVDDLDWGLRINKAGLKIKHLMDCEILHVANQSGKQADRSSTEFQGTSYFWKKHYGLLGKLMFDYFRFVNVLRDYTVRILQKVRLMKFQSFIFSIYMIFCVPIEILIMVPLEIRHQFLISNFPSHKSLKSFMESLEKQ